MLTNFLKSELFSCLPKVDHVIKSCKEPILSNGKGSTEMTRPVKVDPFKAGFEYAGRTKPKWTVPFDVPTEISGILG